MKVRTLEDLSSILSADLSWRKKELHGYLSTIERYDRDTPLQKSFIRSSIVMLYAHWEGFIKKAIEAYLLYLSKRRIKLSDLPKGIHAIDILKKFTTINQFNYFQLSQIIELIIYIENKQTMNASSYKAEKIFERTSNINYDNFMNILLIAGIDNEYETKKVMIDNHLLHNRNNIAHGTFLHVSLETYKDTHDGIMNMLNGFKNHIENRAQSLSKIR